MDKELSQVAKMMSKMVREKLRSDTLSKEELVGVAESLLDLLDNYEHMLTVYKNGISFRDEHIAALERLNDRLEEGLRRVDHGLEMMEIMVRPLH